MALVKLHEISWIQDHFPPNDLAPLSQLGIHRTDTLCPASMGVGGKEGFPISQSLLEALQSVHQVLGLYLIVIINK